MKSRTMAVALAAIAAAQLLPAAEVTPGQAETAAKAWIARGSQRLDAEFRSSDIAARVTMRNKSNRAIYHAFNMEGGGYVIMAGDTRLAPVVAFSGSGTYVEGEDSPIQALVLDCNEALIADLDAIDSGATPPFDSDAMEEFSKAEAEWSRLLGNKSSRLKTAGMLYTSNIDDICVYPLVRTQWGQSDDGTYNIFNYYTPNNYKCGCVATAGAQIMKRWEWPDSVGSFSEYCFVDSLVTKKSSKPGPIPWAAMPDNIFTERGQRAAVGKLTYNVGVAVNMNWTKKGGASGGRLLDDALRERFGYRSADYTYLGSPGIGEDVGGSVKELKDLVYPNLDAGMPVAMDVRKTLWASGGHTVILDGYGYADGTRYTHVNFGWLGSSDGWYNLIHEKMERYERYLGIVHNIHPTVNAKNIISGRVTTADGRPIVGVKVELLRSSGTAIATTSDPKGIFFFRGSSMSGDQTVRATYGSVSQTRKFTIGSPPNKWAIDFTFDVAREGDAYDPEDGYAWAGDSQIDRLSMLGVGPTATRLSKTHTLSSTDLCDFFEVVMPYGYTYTLESVGESDLKGALFSSPYADEKSQVAYGNGGGSGGNFRIEYMPTNGVSFHYLRVSCKNQGENASYQIRCSSHPGDSFDPGDDTAADGTLLVPDRTIRTHGPHMVTDEDEKDYYKAFLSAGIKYVFMSTGDPENPLYAELYCSDKTTSANLVASHSSYDDGNFRIEYTPDESKMHYLCVDRQHGGVGAEYALKYYLSVPQDARDPGDDTASGGTLLTPETSARTTVLHTLSDSDKYDFFRVAMTAGRKYVFESTGDFDMYCELFNSTSTNASDRVAYNDDGGTERNFKLEYTPSVSQTYYLRVRHYVTGSDASYFLKYSYVSTQCTVSFNANGGSPTPSPVTVEKGRSISFPSSPTKSGYVFDGWWTAQSGGTKVTSSTVVSGNMTVWAHWKEPSASTPTAARIAFRNIMGETIHEWAGYVGESIGPLPEPETNPGYRFLGWKRDEDGEMLTANSKFLSYLDVARQQWDEISAYANGYTWSYTVDERGKATIVKAAGTSRDPAVSPEPTGAVSVPSSLDGYTVVEIGNYAFSGCDGLTSAYIPPSVKVIGDHAFDDCSNLERVTGMNNVEAIGMCAFLNCKTLKTLPALAKVRVVEYGAFTYCESIETFAFDVLEEIDNYAFQLCRGLKTVTLPVSLRRIGSYAFMSCRNMTTLNMPANEDRVMGTGAFAYCSGLAQGDFVVVDGVMYHYLGNSSEVIVPDGVEKIDGLAFYDVETYERKTVTTLTLDAARVTQWTFGSGTFSNTGLATVNIVWPETRAGDDAAQCLEGAKAAVSSVYSKPVTYNMDVRVAFDAGDGEPRETVLDVQAGSALGSKLNGVQRPVRDGFEFDGWWTEPYGGEAVTSSTKVNGPVTFYAHWTWTGLYTVQYHKCDGSDETADQGLVVGQKGSLLLLGDELGWEREGYKFLGWAETASGAVKYADGAEVTDLAMEGGTKHLYAHWTQASTTLTIGGKESLSRQYSCEAVAGAYFSVASDGSWTVTSDSSWIKLATAGGSGNGKVTYSLEENTGTSQRVGTIKIKSGSITCTCTITQDKPLLIGGKTSMSRSYEAAKQSDCYFSVTCSQSPWTAVSSASWVALKPGSASGTGSGKVYYDIAANASSSSRTATVKVTSRGLTRTCTITQKAGAEPTLTIGGGKTSMSRAYSCAAKEGESFSVACNGSWTATASASWITISSGMSGSGNGTVKYSLAENTGTSKREGTIKVKCGGLTRTCAITQDKPLLIGGKTSMSRTYEAAKQTGCYFSVTCSQSSWTAVSSASWLTVKTASGMGTTKLYYDVSANTSSSRRAATITVTSRGLSRVCTITQKGVSLAVPRVMPVLRARGAADLPAGLCEGKLADGDDGDLIRGIAYMQDGSVCEMTVGIISDYAVFAVVGGDVYSGYLDGSGGCELTGNGGTLSVFCIESTPVGFQTRAGCAEPERGAECCL